MTDPMSVELVATAITEAVKAAAGDAGKQVWSGLTGLVRRVFGRDSQESTAVDAVEANPDNQLQTGILAGSLVRLAHTDPAFATELHAWLDTLATVAGPRTGDGDVTNIIGPSAQVGRVLQARDIHGSVSFGSGSSWPSRNEP